MDAPLQFADEEARLLLQQRGELAARGRLGDHVFSAFASQRRPFVDRAPGDDGNIMACFARHAAAPGEIAAHPPRPGVIGGGGKPEIAELAAQLAQKLGRLGQRRHRIEGVEQAAFVGGVGHELRDPLRAMPAAGDRPDRIRPEPAFLPDDAREEFEGQAVRLRRRLENHADRFHRLAEPGRLRVRSRLRRGDRAIALGTGPAIGRLPGRRVVGGGSPCGGSSR